MDAGARFVLERGGWTTSLRGAALVTIETLPASTLSDQLCQAGYEVLPADPPEGQRLLGSAIVELVAVEGSSIPQRIHHDTGTHRRG